MKIFDLFLGVRNTILIDMHLVRRIKRWIFSLIYIYNFTLQNKIFSWIYYTLFENRQLQCHLAWKTENNLFKLLILEVKTINVTSWKF